MRKEFRNELRILKKNRSGVSSDLKKERSVYKKTIANAKRNLARSEKACGRATSHIEKRIAILEGRLSS